jgi:hypothetical protein
MINTIGVNQFNTVMFVDESNHPVSEEYKERKYRVVVQTTLFSQRERLFRGILAVSAIVATVGLILIFKAPQMRQLLTLKEKSVKEIERTLIFNPHRNTDAAATTEKEQPKAGGHPLPIPLGDGLKPKAGVHPLPIPPKDVPKPKAGVHPLPIPLGDGLKPKAGIHPLPIPLGDGLKPKAGVHPLPIPLGDGLKPKAGVHPLPIPPEGAIQNGYGEYLVYRMSDGGKRIAVSEEEYKKIFDVIEQSRAKALENRYEHLKEKIQEKLGKEVHLAFIPRTLYEQIFLHECVQEELFQGKSLNARESGAVSVFDTTKEEGPKRDKSSFLGAELSSAQRKQLIQSSMQKTFWQLCVYNDQDYELGFKKLHEDDYRQEHLVKVAARLNEVALGKFKGTGDGFTFKEIAEVQSQEIDFFKSMRDLKSETHTKEVSFHTFISLAQRFRNERPYAKGYEFFPLGIADKSERIVREAVQLECTADAVNHLLLYRGSKFDQDEVTREEHRSVSANSLSFGTSPYGGVLNDGGATAICYMQQQPLNSHVFMIPLQEQLAGRTPFHAYFVHPLISLGSFGETFHARTKIWKLPEDAKVLGFLGIGSSAFSTVKECCKTRLSEEEVKASFAEYKRKAYILAAS